MALCWTLIDDKCKNIPYLDMKANHTFTTHFLS